MNNKNNFLARYGQWALVTGAAQGLGAEFAKQLAAEGMSIVLVDIQVELLENLAKEISQQYNVQTRVISVDLASEDFMSRIKTQTNDIDISLLVNNAGLSSIIPFFSQTEQQLLAQLHVNTRAALQLTYYYSQLMAQKNKGGIIFVSSGAGDFSSAFNASYSATKAWGLKFAESLWFELKPKGIDVLALQPVSTDTPAVHLQGINSSSKLMSTEQCVSEALSILGQCPSWVPGRINRLGHFVLTHFIPKKLRIALVSKELQRLFIKLRE